MTPITAHPLSWPLIQPRTPANKRTYAAFDRKRSLVAARDEMLEELRKLGASSVVISSNLKLRQDGLPAANQARPLDPGVAVYFYLGGPMKGQPHVLACDRWDRIEDNMWAIRLHIQALRGTERWGVGKANQAFAGYRALPDARTDQAMTVEQAAEYLASKSSPEYWKRSELINDRLVLEDAYRIAAKRTHPDAGGSHEDFVRLQEAKRVLDEHYAKGGKS